MKHSPRTPIPPGTEIIEILDSDEEDGFYYSFDEATYMPSSTGPFTVTDSSGKTLLVVIKYLLLLA